MNKFGHKIRSLRERHNDRMEDLAAKLNMTASSLGKYERGERKITPEFLMEVAKIYEEPISFFFGEEIEVPEDFKEVGVKWIAFAREMEEKKLTPEQIKATLELIATLGLGNKQ